MQPLMSNYARTFNHKYGLDGHLFDSRYGSGLIEDERYFLEVSRYIHLNPVKAQMVSTPMDYEYSSYGLYMDPVLYRGSSPVSRMIGDLVDTSHIKSWFGNDAAEQYRMFVEVRNSHAEQEMMIQKEINEYSA